MTMYEKTGQEKYLETVSRAFDYYRTYWRNNQNTAFIAWHSRTDYKLYQATDNREVADFVFEINDYLLEQYQSSDNCQSFNFDKGSVTAVHLEGIVQALKLATQLEDQPHRNCYQNFTEQGMAYLVSLQVPADSDLPLPAIGGIWDGPQKQSQRVDRNQHAVMALMDYLDYLN
jgi:hypothetical protein